MPKQTANQGRQWYVIHTYSGYEENVAYNLRKRIESMGMEEKIFDVIVPKEKKIKVKNGKRTVVEEKIYPGYVMINMIVTDDSWYVVRNTPNVTGILGTDTIPTPISDEDLKTLQRRMGIEEPTYAIDMAIGEPVRIVDGPFKDMEGKVSEVDTDRGKIKVMVSMFGRETPVELDSLQVKKI
jgi:transcriptional antiterminator NusG